MAAPFLIIAVVALSVLFLVMVGLIIIYFGHPDDFKEAIVPRLVTVPRKRTMMFCNSRDD
jgi:hypothetical protein